MSLDEMRIPVDFDTLPVCPPIQSRYTIDDWTQLVGEEPAPHMEDAAYHALMPAIVLASAINDLAGLIGYELAELRECIHKLRG
jgi:hypothetical protein